MPAPGSSPDASQRPPAWRPSRRALLIVGIAFALGLFAFLALWTSQRDDGFYRSQAPVPGVAGQQFEPLPTPLPAGDAANASGMGMPAEEGDTAPRIVEQPQQVAPPLLPPAAPVPAAPSVAMAPGTIPVPIDSPAPDYPPEALRRGESGTVLLRIHVGPDGVPAAIDLVRSSRSRALDRAAIDAVQRWRFRPAQRDGQPVDGAVQIPISFAADR